MSHEIASAAQACGEALGSGVEPARAIGTGVTNFTTLLDTILGYLNSVDTDIDQAQIVQQEIYDETTPTIGALATAGEALAPHDLNGSGWPEIAGLPANITAMQEIVRVPAGLVGDLATDPLDQIKKDCNDLQKKIKELKQSWDEVPRDGLAELPDRMGTAANNAKTYAINLFNNGG